MYDKIFINKIWDEKMSFSKTIQILIFDGNPNGRMMCEFSNWNGRVYKISRNELNIFSQRPDAEFTGVYFLYGKDETNNETVYIGEAEKIFSRLKQHLQDSSYWNDCIVVLSKDNILNKAHAKYLEHSFYQLAIKAERAVITNATIPTRSSVSEYDEAMLQEFINRAKLLVNTLGYKTFETLEESAVKKENQSVTFAIHAARNADATGIIVTDGFAVLKNSKIADSTVPSMSPSLINLRNELIQKNIIDPSTLRFTRDYIFTSPSLAAATVLGRNANGRTEWKTSDHKTIKDIEEI